MTIFALLIAIVLYHFVKDLVRLRSSAWLRHFVTWANERLSILPGWAGPTSFALLLAVPLLVLHLLGWIAWSSLGNLGYFVFTVLVLTYCLGPRGLDDDVSRIVAAESAEEKEKAAAALLDSEPPEDEDDAMEALTMAVLSLIHI